MVKGIGPNSLILGEPKEVNDKKNRRPVDLLEPPRISMDRDLSYEI